MSETNVEADTGPAGPVSECDVVMKGGITSGVIYPGALHAIGSRYRIRGIGGASAGAIGAAVGAAGEFGREVGGFAKLKALPEQLSDGKLAALFHPNEKTKPLLGLMLAATGDAAAGPPPTKVRKVLSVLGGVVGAFPVASVIGILPGVAAVVVGVSSGGVAGWALVAAGAILLVVGWLVAIGVRLVRKMTVDVPGNMFGICTGVGPSDDKPGFTDWLSGAIDDIAGLDVEARPLRFGQLWAGSAEISDEVPHEVPREAPDDAPEEVPIERDVDLRMITTCLSEGRPYEMPWDAHVFFYDSEQWGDLFPANVMEALHKAPPPATAPGRDAEWRWEEQLASTHDPPLRRLPAAAHLPVIVATRMSLSFPLLISAVPLWAIDRRHPHTRQASQAFQAAVEPGDRPTSGLEFQRLWFTDGGFCSNFPVHLFDAALPSRPTFAINLGRFSDDRPEPDPDPLKNIEWARSNRAGLLPRRVEIPDRGFGAVGGFASAAINTSRNWQDSSHLSFPGYRDRIVRVLQTAREGGMNLHMKGEKITELSNRGAVAGTAMIEQFTEPRYPTRAPVATGWDNHRWVRYRALLSVLPEWLKSYAKGRVALQAGIDPKHPPSYGYSAGARDLAGALATALDDVAGIVASADPKQLAELMSEPRPVGSLRRIPPT